MVSSEDAQNWVNVNRSDATYPSSDTWGSKEQPGPAQQAGWQEVGRTAVSYTTAKGYRSSGRAVNIPQPVYDEDALRLAGTLRASGKTVAFTPAIDPETGRMAAVMVDEASIVARKLDIPGVEAKQEG